jgi:hypothetical protein
MAGMPPPFKRATVIAPSATLFVAQEIVTVVPDISMATADILSGALLAGGSSFFACAAGAMNANDRMLSPTKPKTRSVFMYDIGRGKRLLRYILRVRKRDRFESRTPNADVLERTPVEAYS